MSAARTITPEDARLALGDALADMMHVLRAEGVDGSKPPSDEEVQFALGVEVANAMPSALRHYTAEYDGGDDLGTVVVELPANDTLRTP